MTTTILQVMCSNGLAATIGFFVFPSMSRYTHVRAFSHHSSCSSHSHSHCMCSLHGRTAISGVCITSAALGVAGYLTARKVHARASAVVQTRARADTHDASIYAIGAVAAI